jgi:hypothetical protein
MVVACIALVLALGGTSYAVVKPGKNSVGKQQLRKAAVVNSKINDNAVNSRTVLDNSLTGSDINEARLGEVPLAAHAATADRATSADLATAAGRAQVAVALERVVYRTATATVAPGLPAASTESDPVSARCDPGQFVVGGGVRLDDNMSVVDAFPDAGGTAWTAKAANDDTASPRNFVVYAICVTANAPG